MQKSAFIFSLLVTTVATAAFAQEAPYSQTLDEQLQRVQSGQAPVPYSVPPQAAAVEPASTPVQDLSPAAGTPQASWPANSDVQPVAREQLATTAVPAYITAPNGEVINSVGSGAIPPLPLQMMTSSSGMKYLTGGIGDEELAQLKSVEGDFNLQLLMAGKKGAYMSGFLLRVYDETNAELLTAYDTGPYFYTRLVPGKYRLEATSEGGVTEKANVTIPAQGAVKPVIRFVAE